MTVLSREVDIVQNPALGAALIWRFTCGYRDGCLHKDATPLPLLFIVLPITLHQETSQFISSTRRKSGLRGFANKFNDSKVAKNDLILSIHERAIQMRSLTLDSLRIAHSSNLLSIDKESATVFPLSLTLPKAGVPPSIRTMLQHVERLGFWCGQVSLHEVSIILKVRF